MSSRELTEWMAFEQIDGPVGSQREDLRAGVVAATIANCHRSKGPAFKPTDFMPYYERPRTDPDAALAALRAAIGRKGAK
jgi:hypothetical protein